MPGSGAPGGALHASFGTDHLDPVAPEEGHHRQHGKHPPPPGPVAPRHPMSIRPARVLLVRSRRARRKRKMAPATASAVPPNWERTAMKSRSTRIATNRREGAARGESQQIAGHLEGVRRDDAPGVRRRRLGHGRGSVSPAGASGSGSAPPPGQSARSPPAPGCFSRERVLATAESASSSSPSSGLRGAPAFAFDGVFRFRGGAWSSNSDNSSSKPQLGHDRNAPVTGQVPGSGNTSWCRQAGTLDLARQGVHTGCKRAPFRDPISSANLVYAQITVQ